MMGSASRERPAARRFSTIKAVAQQGFAAAARGATGRSCFGRGGKSGLRRARGPAVKAGEALPERRRRKVPQKTDRPAFAPGKGEKVV